MNIFQEIERVNVNNKDRIALGLRKANGETVTYTYRKMFEKIELCYNNLLKLGLKRGHRIGIVASSSPEWVINYLAIQKMNATAVLLDYSLEKDELFKLIEKSDLRAVILSENVKQKIGTIRDMPNINVYKFGELFQDSILKIRKTSIEESYRISSIIYSSGTTKTASGIMHNHDNLIKTTYMTINSNNLKKKTVFIGMLPNSHIYGVITQILGPLLLNASIYYLENLDAESLVGSFKEYKPNIFPSVPKVYELLHSQILKKIQSKNMTKVMFEKLFPICLKIRNKTGINLGKYIFSAVQKGFGSNLQIMCSAGSPMSKEVADFFYGTGFKMLITYGATETNIPTIGNYGKNITTNSCGKNYPDVEIKVDDNGELLIKSPYMMLGYFNDKKATSEAFTEDGWFKSGDLARINKFGNVEILGRCKENIVLSNGKKIAPDDIEKNYQNIPLVKDFAICGIPVQDKGYDEIHCFVVANMENQKMIEKYIKDISADSQKNMKIAGIHFVDNIPRTALKKPKRFLLKKIIINEENKQNSTDLEINKKVTVKEIVYSIISKVSNITELNEEMVLMSDLPIDSLSIIEISLEIERIYGLNIEKAITSKTTIADLINIIENPPKYLPAQIKEFLLQFPLKKKNSDYRVFKFYSNMIRKIYKINIENDNQLPENSGYIICSNHVSNFDYLYLTANFTKERFKNFYCVAKQELFKNNPLTKLFIRIAGMIPIDRKGFASETITKVSEKMREKCGVMIFPEGTRSKTGELGIVKKGAAMISIENNVPIIPAYIQGAYEIYPPTKKLPKLFNWKTKKKYEVSVIYGEPIFPNGKSIEQITKEINEAILELSGKVNKSSRLVVV